MLNKRIILMYISEISGHHSATLAIEKAIKMLAPDTEVLNINAFNYTNPVFEKIVNRFYMGVIKATPKIWDYLYDNPKIVKKVEKIKDKIHKFNSPKLKSLFDKFRPDAVCCTQAFPCGMVADFKKEYNSALPLVAVLTDYIPHSYWIYDTVDYYVVPSEEVAGRLIEKEVSRGKIRSLGIPFDHKFNEPVDKAQVIKRMGLNLDAVTVLIMGGGQGLGPIETIVKSLEKVKTELQEIIVTGTNKKLYDSLKKKIKKYSKTILMFSYTDKISEFMSAADIIITKPGGITTAEALSKKLPMIIIKPIPGQEQNNTSYLIEKRAAIQINDAKKIHFIIEDMLLHRDRLNRLAYSAGRISKPNASLDIAHLLLNVNNV